MKYQFDVEYKITKCWGCPMAIHNSELHFLFCQLTDQKIPHVGDVALKDVDAPHWCKLMRVG